MDQGFSDAKQGFEERTQEEAQTGFEPVNSGFAIRSDCDPADSERCENSCHTNELRHAAADARDFGRGMVEEKSDHDRQQLAEIDGSEGQAADDIDSRLELIIGKWPDLSEAARDRLYGMLLAFVSDGKGQGISAEVLAAQLRRQRSRPISEDSDGCNSVSTGKAHRA